MGRAQRLLRKDRQDVPAIITALTSFLLSFLLSGFLLSPQHLLIDSAGNVATLRPNGPIVGSQDDQGRKIDEVFDLQGKLFSQTNLFSDRNNGFYRTFYPDGSLAKEIIYRGVLYTAIEKNTGKWAAISVVTFLFWGVHVAQYYNSVATLVAVFVLSFVLTYLRAWTGKLLPGIIVHFIFNGVQGLVIVFAPQKALSPDPATPPAQAAMMIGDAIMQLLHWH